MHIDPMKIVVMGMLMNVLLALVTGTALLTDNDVTMKVNSVLGEMNNKSTMIQEKQQVYTQSNATGNGILRPISEGVQYIFSLVEGAINVSTAIGNLMGVMAGGALRSGIGTIASATNPIERIFLAIMTFFYAFVNIMIAKEMYAFFMNKKWG